MVIFHCFLYVHQRVSERQNTLSIPMLVESSPNLDGESDPKTWRITWFWADDDAKGKRPKGLWFYNILDNIIQWNIISHIYIYMYIYIIYICNMIINIKDGWWFQIFPAANLAMLLCFTHLVGIPRTGGLNICQRLFSIPRTGLWCHSNGIIIPIVYLRCAKAARWHLPRVEKCGCSACCYPSVIKHDQTWLASKTPITGGLNEKLIERNRDFPAGQVWLPEGNWEEMDLSKKKGTQKSWMSLRQCMIMFCWFSISIFW